MAKLAGDETNANFVDATPSNAARCCYKTKVTKRDLVVASTRHHRARLLKYYPETTERA